MKLVFWENFIHKYFYNEERVPYINKVSAQLRKLVKKTPE